MSLLLLFKPAGGPAPPPPPWTPPATRTFTEWFEGLSAGTSVTLPSQTAFDEVLGNGSATIVGGSLAINKDRSLQIATSANNKSFRNLISGGSTSRRYVRFYLRIDSAPTTNFNLMSFNNGATPVATLQVLTTRRINVRLWNGTALALLGTMTTVLAVGTVYRIEIGLEVASDGAVRIYNAAGTLLEEMTGFQEDSGTFDRWTVGHLSSVTATTTFDSFASDSSTWVGSVDQGELDYAASTGIRNIRVGAYAFGGTGSNSLAVPYPSNVALGEFLTIDVGARMDVPGGVSGSYSASGWTLIENPAGNNAYQAFLWKIADAADVSASAASGSVTVTGPAVLRTMRMLAATGVDSTSPIAGTTVFTGSDAQATALVTMPGQTPPVENCLLLWGASGFQGTTATWQSTKDQVANSSNVFEWVDTWGDNPANSTAGRSACAYYEIWPTATPTGNRGAIPSVAATSSGIFLVIRPAADVSAPVYDAAQFFPFFASVG